MTDRFIIAYYHCSCQKVPLYILIKPKSSPQKICDFFSLTFSIIKIIDIIFKIIFVRVLFCVGFSSNNIISRLFTLLHSMIKKSTGFSLRCFNNLKLNGPGSEFPISMFKLSFYAKRNMVLVEINKKISFKEDTQMEPAARDLLCYWSLREKKSKVSEVSNEGWNDAAWLPGCLDA